MALSVAILLGQVHVSAADSLMPMKQGKDGKNAKAKFLAPAVEEKKEDVPVEFFLSVNVPQNTDAGDEFGIYPYPIAPIAASPPTAIANDTDYLKDILRAIVYEKCGRIDKPVPRDWRLQWAFEHA